MSSKPPVVFSGRLEGKSKTETESGSRSSSDMLGEYVGLCTENPGTKLLFTNIRDTIFEATALLDKSSVIYQKHVSRFLKILQENDIKNVVSFGFNVKIEMQKVIKPANIDRFRSMFHRLKDNDIPKTAVSKSRIPQNELIRVFDKSPTKCCCCTYVTKILLAVSGSVVWVTEVLLAV